MVGSKHSLLRGIMRLCTNIIMPSVFVLFASICTLKSLGTSTSFACFIGIVLAIITMKSCWNILLRKFNRRPPSPQFNEWAVRVGAVFKEILEKCSLETMKFPKSPEEILIIEMELTDAMALSAQISSAKQHSKKEFGGLTNQIANYSTCVTSNYFKSNKDVMYHISEIKNPTNEFVTVLMLEHAETKEGMALYYIIDRNQVYQSQTTNHQKQQQQQPSSNAERKKTKH